MRLQRKQPERDGVTSKARPSETGGEGATEKRGDRCGCQVTWETELLHWLCDTEDIQFTEAVLVEEAGWERGKWRQQSLVYFF